MFMSDWTEKIATINNYISPSLVGKPAKVVSDSLCLYLGHWP